ncbi:exonuclease SbcCD subunit D [Candidatus Woesearchaeota archaeon]|nr:exonuclease SbcCD subunit D [Candidatus Woesearchaeota archaeon]
MKFAHFADIHIGSWADDRLAEASTKAFTKAVDLCLEEKVDFILIAGDFFNTSLPSIDRLKEVTSKLKELSDRRVPVYIIPGSHDFSPTGKTMLDVLENAGLFINVMRGNGGDDGRLHLKFTTDEKTGAKITGIGGKKGMLDRHYYGLLSLPELEAEDGFKIFVFHTAIEEFKPSGLEQMDAVPLAMFPKGFLYYAGGHIHRRFERDVPGYGKMTMPGPLFPNSFDELERLSHGGFHLVEAIDGKVTVTYNPVVVHNVFVLSVDADKKSPEDVSSELLASIGKNEFYNTIVLVRVAGKLRVGKAGDVNLKRFVEAAYGKGAAYVAKNTSKLVGEDFEEVKVDYQSVEDVELRLINEHAGQSKAFPVEKEKEIAHQLLHSLAKEKEEGETTADFEKRIKEDISKVLGITL